MAVLSIKDLSFIYKGANESHLAVKDVNLEIKEGELVSFIGPSGCGKSTVLNILAGLLHPSRGEVLFQGKKVEGPGLERGVVFQNYSLFPWMTAEENILLALQQVRKQDSSVSLKEEAARFLEMVGLKGVEHKYPNQLSGGMQQRVALARLFALDSPVFLMDEPFGALDAAVRSNLQDCLIQLWGQQKQKKTVVLVTHDIDEAILLSDRIVVYTSGPGRIEEVITVELPRPRIRSKVFMSARYLELRNHLLSLLHREDSQDGVEDKVVSL